MYFYFKFLKNCRKGMAKNLVCQEKGKKKVHKKYTMQDLSIFKSEVCRKSTPKVHVAIFYKDSGKKYVLSHLEKLTN